MKRTWLAILALVTLLASTPALADTPILLFKSFAGNINLTGTQKTLRTSANGIDACATASSVTMSLTGIPSGGTVLASYLYWAGSGSTADYTVTFDGKSITAPATRQYKSSTVGYDYFGGAADVTDQVKAKGNGSYTASGLAISKDLFCAVQGVMGGFQLLVVYSQGNESFRVLNVYEGFQYIRNSTVELTLANFQIPNPIGTLTGRVGHITWEGDTTLSGGGETLRYNGVEQTDSMNGTGNQFNSASSVNNDSVSYGIDFDTYTVKSPTIASGQKSAKTTYMSGNDLVLLSAEVIAAPNVPATDRGVTLTLNGTLTPSAATTYTITVANNGPMAEGGPLTVTGTLPASLISGGATGTDWTCTVVSQVLTCTYAKTAAVNAAIPPITLTVTPAANATGIIMFGVTVSGKLFDYYDGNDTSTVSARVGAQNFTPVFIFTDGPCVHNRAFGHNQQTCKPLSLTKMNANTDLNTWITYVANNVPTALASSATTLPMRFALSCHDPVANAGVRATYNLRSTSSVSSSTITLPLCIGGGAIPEQNSAAWSTAQNVLFPAGVPSSKAVSATADDDPTDFVFRYQDVGRIELFVTDNTARLGSTGAFVSRPEKLQLLADATNKAGDPASATDGRFVAAGVPYTMTVRALMAGMTTPAPNFGRETSPEKIALTVFPATASDGQPIDAMVADLAVDDYYKTPLALRGGFGAFTSGIATGTDFAFDEVGVIKIDSALADGSYLDSGDVNGNTINVGRFYPHHFDTIVTGKMTCVEAALCPANPASTTVPSVAIATMSYSGQPLTVQVLAKGKNNNTLNYYRNELARNVALSAFKAPNGTVAQTAPLSGTTPSTFTNTALASTVFVKGSATVSPVYTFPAALAFTRTAPAANNWSQPVSVYVRAIESSGVDNATSARSDAVEGGVQVLSGRMWVESLPAVSAAESADVDIKAQFYGKLGGLEGWYDATTDSVSTFAPQANVKFSTCAKVPNAASCSLNLAVSNTTVGNIVNGAGLVKLGAPGTGSSGIVSMWLESPAWLPSAYGVLTYGAVPARPYTYLREMY